MKKGDENEDEDEKRGREVETASMWLILNSFWTLWY